MASTSNDEELKSSFEIDNLKGYHHCDDLSHDHPHHQHGVTLEEKGHELDCADLSSS